MWQVGLSRLPSCPCHPFSPADLSLEPTIITIQADPSIRSRNLSQDLPNSLIVPRHGVQLIRFRRLRQARILGGAQSQIRPYHILGWSAAAPRRRHVRACLARGEVAGDRFDEDELADEREDDFYLVEIDAHVSFDVD